MPRKTVYTDLASSKRNKREIIQLIQQFAEKNRIGAFAPPPRGRMGMEMGMGMGE